MVYVWSGEREGGLVSVTSVGSRAVSLVTLTCYKLFFMWGRGCRTSGSRRRSQLESNLLIYEFTSRRSVECVRHDGFSSSLTNKLESNLLVAVAHLASGDEPPLPERLLVEAEVEPLAVVQVRPLPPAGVDRALLRAL